MPVLPQSLWQYTGLGRASHVSVRASRVGASNILLTPEPRVDRPTLRLVRRANLPTGATPPAWTGVPIPVVPLQPEALGAWARTLTNPGAWGVTALLLRAASRNETSPDTAGKTTPSLTADERLVRFSRMASPTSRKLAGCFAAAPLRMPIMRVVQRAVLPDSENLHLAEVLLGNLLQPIPAASEDPDDLAFEFHPGVREALLDRQEISHSLEVYTTVTRWVSEHFGETLDFQAILENPDGFASLPITEKNRPFASIAAELLKRLGGRYARAADRLGHQIPPPQLNQDDDVPPVSRRRPFVARLNWLHLTDLHFGLNRQAPLWPRMFFDDLQRAHERTGPWSVVLFSGDLVQQGSRDEFQKLEEQVLAPLWEQMKQLGSEPQLLSVPGNHDLVRPDSKKPTAAPRQLLRKDGFQEISDELLGDPTCEYRHIIDKAFANYAEWWRRTPFRHLQVRDGLLPGEFSVTLDVDDVRIGVVGLNTTFLQLAGGDFQGRLAWDVRQFHAACTGDLHGDGPGWIRDHDLCLLMTHHGPEWLDKHSRDVVYPEINPAGRFLVHLFGHMHENVVRLSSSNGGGLPRLWQGNSLFGVEKFGDPPQYDRGHGYRPGQSRSKEI